MCEKCDATMDENAAEILRYSKSQQWATDIEESILFSDAMSLWANGMIRTNMDHLARKAASEGIESYEFAESFAIMMMKMGFIVGVRNSEIYRAAHPLLELDGVSVTQEEVEEFKSEQHRMKEERDAAGPPIEMLKEAIQNLLKENGIDPDNVRIMELMDLEDVPKASEGKEPETGMYL